MSNKNLYTIIYYTSNREDEAFEQKIRQKLLEVSADLPIISVSQKPINLGKNICVGDVGACDANLFRQIQLACEAATTPFVMSAEADCLYPPEYFQYDTSNLDTDKYYRFDNLYILSQWGEGDYGGFYKKDTAPFAQIIGRELYLNMIKKALPQEPVWHSPKQKVRIPLFLDQKWETVHINTPILNFKTYNGMRRHTKTIGSAVGKLPYWGTADEVRKQMWS